MNPELHLKDTESVIKSKLRDILPEVNEIKFLTTMVSEFQKIERDDETKYSTIYTDLKTKLE